MPFWRKSVIQPALDSAESAAVREQQELLRKDPLDPKPHFALGVLAHLQGRTDEAVQYLLKAIELDPSSADPHVSLGRIFAVQGETELAWQHARAAERLGDRALVEQLERYPIAARPPNPQP